MTDIGNMNPAGILAFWREAGRERWYKRSDAFDADISRRTHGLVQQIFQVIGPPAAGVEQIFARRVNRPANGAKADRLRRGTGPEERLEA